MKILWLLLFLPTVTNANTYYVAINEPGASNDQCDGRSPTDMGDGHCPYKDFLSAHTFRLLWDQLSVRVEVRQGVYDLAPTVEGLEVRGAGTNPNELTVLTNYQDERVVFEGNYAVQAVLRVSGQYNVVENITVQGGGGHNIIILGGNNHTLRNLVVGPNGSSDSLKGTGNADQVVIEDSSFFGFQSQAIDAAGVHNWVIQRNLFNNPGTLATRSIGIKFASTNFLIENNIFYGLGLSLGGTSGNNPETFEARNLIVMNNIFFDVTSKELVKFYSCQDCEFSHNIAYGTFQIGYVLGGEGYEGPSGCPGGSCEPSKNVSIHYNRFHGMPDVQGGYFVGEELGFSANSNLYCGGGQFFISPNIIPFTEWQQESGQDSDSGLC